MAISPIKRTNIHTMIVVIGVAINGVIVVISLDLIISHFVIVDCNIQLLSLAIQKKLCKSNIIVMAIEKRMTNKWQRFHLRQIH